MWYIEENMWSFRKKFDHYLDTKFVKSKISLDSTNLCDTNILVILQSFSFLLENKKCNSIKYY